MKKFNFEYTKLSQDEINARGILGRLVGPIADTTSPTRNGRLYPRELWEKVFSNPILQEKINNRCLFQELGHPTDRTEVEMEKICACMSETPKIGDDGLVYGVFDILPTNNGKLLKVLCDYGTNIGISSRGSGDIIEDMNGNESVDPDTYECETWDFVILPAVEKARLTYVTESYNGKSLKATLNEALNEANSSDRKIMEETLSNLNIDYSTQVVNNINESVVQESVDNNEGVDDVKPEEIVKSLQEALLSKSKTEANLFKLQEQLAVGNAKVEKLTSEVNRYKKALVKLGEKSSETNALKEQVEKLSKDLNEQKTLVENQSKTINVKNLEIKRLKAKASDTSLKEDLNAKNLKIEELTKEIETLNESTNAKVAELNEKINTLRENATKRSDEYHNKLEKAKSIVEQYKKSTYEVIDRYIESKAKVLGVSSNEIKNRLSESYTIDDIDNVCDELLSYNVNMSKLPFNITKGKNVKARITESKNDPFADISNISESTYDDEVDESLLNMASIK